MEILRSQLPQGEGALSFTTKFHAYVEHRTAANEGLEPMPFPEYEIFRVAAERGEDVFVVDDPVQDVHEEPTFEPIPVKPGSMTPTKLTRPIFDTSIKPIFKRRP